MRFIVFSIFFLVLTNQGFCQGPISPERVKGFVQAYYSFSDTTQWKNHIKITHPKLRADTFQRQFVVDLMVYRSKTHFNTIEISSAKCVAREIKYDNFIISKWKITGCAEVILSKNQRINSKATIDSINSRAMNGYYSEANYYSLKEGSDSIIQTFKTWHVILFKYTDQSDYFIIPYESGKTPETTSIFPYKATKLKLAFEVVPLNALMKLENVDGVSCDTLSIPIEKFDAAILDAIKSTTIENFLCKVGINYRTVKGIKNYEKKSVQGKFEAVVERYNMELELMYRLKKLYEENTKRGQTYTNQYNGSSLVYTTTTEGEFCEISMNFTLLDQLSRFKFVCAKLPQGWVLIDINGHF